VATAWIVSLSGKDPRRNLSRRHSSFRKPHTHIHMEFNFRSPGDVMPPGMIDLVVLPDPERRGLMKHFN
jgi:hypothetical protein